jgi:hypothetical protein
VGLLSRKGKAGRPPSKIGRTLASFCEFPAVVELERGMNSVVFASGEMESWVAMKSFCFLTDFTFLLPLC